MRKYEKFYYETHFLLEGLNLFFIPQYTGEHDQENLPCRPAVHPSLKSNEADFYCFVCFQCIQIKGKKTYGLHYGELKVKLHTFLT